MKEQSLDIKYTKTDFLNLSSDEKKLITSAKEKANCAYAPYSGLLVGASVLMQNGEIISANNQENIAYPSGLCAERVALFYAVSQFPENGIETIAITANSSSFKMTSIISPCGACRQVMSEYEKKQGRVIRLLLHHVDDSVLIVNSVTDLLPFLFMDSSLKRC